MPFGLVEFHTVSFYFDIFDCATFQIYNRLTLTCRKFIFYA